MENKHKLIIVALIGILFYTYPSTLALFMNDHAYYNGSSPCSKCHTDIQAQIEDIGRVNTIHRTLDDEDGCKACHANQNNTFRTRTQDYHAAYTPNCIECHQNASSISGSQEAHTIIVTGGVTVTMTENKACAMCHTTLYTSVTVRNRQVFAFEPDSIASNSSPVYDGTYTTTALTQPPTGDHNFISNVQCIACHMPVYEILNQSRDPNQEHRRFGCDGCHRGTGDEAGHTNETQVTYHAAKTKYCSDCHGQVDYPRDCNQCHDSHGGFKPGVD